MRLIIHEKIYDLQNFNHPGGKEILELCKNEPDCTALFESYHAFCDYEKIKRVMEKYEIANTTKQSIFSFKEDGFYKLCKKKVQKHIGVNNSKATCEWYITSSIAITMFITCQYFLLFYKAGLIKAIMSIFSGLSLGSLGYNILHDGSHYAISKRPNINRYSSMIIQTLLIFNNTLWTYHHCIRHHQYTGNLELDPDTRAFEPFFRKSTRIPANKLEFSKAYIGLKIILFNTIFPGTATGQSLSYHFNWAIMQKMWNMSIPDIFWRPIDFLQYFISAAFIVANIYYGGFFYFFLHSIGLNLLYWVGAAPDHDLYPTHLEMEKDNDKDFSGDWGELQVRHSANFMNNWPIFTRIGGGINYQIEHHLFPTLSNHKLPKISRIVKETCKEFNIPYNSIDSPIDVFDNLCKTYMAVHK